MARSPAAGTVRAAHVLVTVLLVVALASLALGLVSVLVGLARDGRSLLYGDSLRVPVQLSPEDIGSLPPELRVHGWVAVDLEIADPTPGQMLLRAALEFGPTLLLTVGLWLLRGFLRSVVHGDPFGPPNVRRLRRLGFLLVVGGPMIELLDYSLRQVLFSKLPPVPSVNLGVAGFTLPGGWLLAGLAVFVLAEVFAFGLRLHEDVEGTV